MDDKAELIEMTAEIVAAYVTSSHVPLANLHDLMRSVHSTLSGLSGDPHIEEAPPPTPAVSIKKSISPDYLTCLEDGRKFKSLKRHLQTKYGMSPEQYRAKWGLPRDYPMVAPNYAAARSNMAKQMGLGQGGRRRAAPFAATPVAPAEPAPPKSTRRGRPKKAG